MDKASIYRKISALRKSLQALEEELGMGQVPNPRKRKNAYLKQLEECGTNNTWRKPTELKKASHDKVCKYGHD